jgi:hypothetical protein
MSTTTFYYKLKTNKIKPPLKKEEDNIPSIREMYEMIIHLTNKYHDLEKKYNQLKKVSLLSLSSSKNYYSIETYRKDEFNIDIFEFINTQFIVQLEDVQYLFHKTFLQTFERIVSRLNLSSSFICNSSKPFHIYGFFQEKQQWQELNNDILVSLFNKCKRIFFSSAFEYKLQNQSKIDQNEKMEDLFANLLNKVTSVELSNKNTFHKFKHIFVQYLDKEDGFI